MYKYFLLNFLNFLNYECLALPFLKVEKYIFLKVYIYTMIFQQKVLIIATILLIVILIVVGILLSKSSDNEDNNWPPIVGDCPDFWVDMSGNGEACLNTQGLGTCNLPSSTNKNTKNFNEAPFNGEDSKCRKYTWAKTCQITWDGITSGVKNPCDKP